MLVEVIVSPLLLTERHLSDRVVVVIDTLRATTTMAIALHNGAKLIRVFGEVDEARAAAQGYAGRRLLCGERHAKPPAGFDLGNSPGDFTRERCEGATLFMTTTNGTAAIIAAAGAARMLVAAPINRAAVATVLREDGRDVTLLCAGQRSDFAAEDVYGAGAILDALGSHEAHNDAAWTALDWFRQHQENPEAMFRRCLGARTELLNGLAADVEFCTRLDRVNVIGEVRLAAFEVFPLTT